MLMARVIVEKNPPPPPGPSMSEQLRQLGKDKSLLIQGGSVSGARAVISRVASQTGRKFRTTNTKKGLRVWRVA